MTGKYFARGNQTEFETVMEREDENHWRNILDIISTLPGYEWLRKLMQRLQHEEINRFYVADSTPQLSQTPQTAPQGQISGQGNISNIGINTTQLLQQLLQQHGNDIDNDTMMAINETLSVGSQYEDEQFVDDDDDEDDINRKIVQSQSQHPTVNDFDDSNLDSEQAKELLDDESSDEENSEERLERLRIQKRENEKIHLQDQFQHQHMSTNPSSHQQQFQISQTAQTHQQSPSYQYPYAPTPNPYQQNNNSNTNTIFTSSNINTSTSSHQQQQNEPQNDVTMHIQEHATTPPVPSIARIPSHRSDQYSHSDFEASQMNVEDNAGSDSDNGITDTTTMTNIGRQQ